MPRDKVQVGIEAKDDASKKFDELSKNAKKSMKDMERSASSASGNMVASFKSIATAIAGAYAAVRTLQGAWDTLAAGSKISLQAQAFSNLAGSYGVNSQSIINNLRRISNQTVDTATLVEKSGTAMLMGIPADKIAALMRIAMASMKVTGQSATEAFGDIVLAVARQSKMILDNLGIVMKLEDAYKHYADQLGKTVEQLTEAERKQAFLNETLTKGGDFIERIGEATGTDFQEMAKFTTNLKNTFDEISKLMAKDMVPIFQALNKILELDSKAIYEFGKTVIVSGGIILAFTNTVGRLIKNFKDIIPLIGMEAFSAVQVLSIGFRGLATGIALSMSSISGITAAVFGFYQLIKERDPDIDALAESLGITKKEFDAVTGSAKEAKKAVEEYAEATLEAEIKRQELMIARGAIGDAEDPLGYASEAIINRRKAMLVKLKQLRAYHQSKEQMSGLEDFYGVPEKAKDVSGDVEDYKKAVEEAAKEQEKFNDALINTTGTWEIMQGQLRRGVGGGLSIDRDEMLKDWDTKLKALGMSPDAAKAAYEAEIEANRIKNETIVEQEAEAQDKIDQRAKEMKAMWRSVADQMADVLGTGLGDIVTGATTAKEAFANMARSMSQWLMKLAVQMIFMQSIKAMGWGGFFGMADGGVVTGGFQAFANGGVASSPTVGMIGEGRFNEAVVPLPDGNRIPVEIRGGGGGNVIFGDINVQMPPGMNSDADAKRHGKVLADAMKQELKQYINNAMRPGGQLNRSQQGVY